MLLRRRHRRITSFTACQDPGTIGRGPSRAGFPRAPRRPVSHRAWATHRPAGAPPPPVHRSPHLPAMALDDRAIPREGAAGRPLQRRGLVCCKSPARAVLSGVGMRQGIPANGSGRPPAVPQLARSRETQGGRAVTSSGLSMHSTLCMRYPLSPVYRNNEILHRRTCVCAPLVRGPREIDTAELKYRGGGPLEHRLWGAWQEATASRTTERICAPRQNPTARVWDLDAQTLGPSAWSSAPACWGYQRYEWSARSQLGTPSEKERSANTHPVL